MFRIVPFNIRENAERGREALEKVLDFASDQSITPLGKVSGALASFRVDAIDTESAYEILAELPGFNKDNITISYDDNNYLKIKAERPENNMNVRYLCRERRDGVFERTFIIDDIDKDSVNVSYDGGILHIILPKLKNNANKTIFDID